MRFFFFIVIYKQLQSVPNSTPTVTENAINGKVFRRIRRMNVLEMRADRTNYMLWTQIRNSFGYFVQGGVYRGVHFGQVKCMQLDGTCVATAHRSRVSNGHDGRALFESDLMIVRSEIS